LKNLHGGALGKEVNNGTQTSRHISFLLGRHAVARAVRAGTVSGGDTRESGGHPPAANRRRQLHAVAGAHRKEKGHLSVPSLLAAVQRGDYLNR
jgi:hypothetical protein